MQHPTTVPPGVTMSTVKHAADRLTAPTAPRAWARVHALLHPGSLDRRLAAGADPSRDPELAARATLLLRRTTRLQIAEGLEAAVASAHARSQGHPLSAVVPVAGPAVRAAIDDLVALALRLRAPEPVRPQGVALARDLLVDGTGPLYAGRPAGGELPRAARHALAALDDGPAWR